MCLCIGFKQFLESFSTSIHLMTVVKVESNGIKNNMKWKKKEMKFEKQEYE